MLNNYVCFCNDRLFSLFKKRMALLVFLVFAGININFAQTVQFIYTSDQHYGLTKTTFQGAANVDAKIVNAALVAKMNTISAMTLPNKGVNAGKPVGPLDFIIETGDIANRQDSATHIQNATTSWGQFVTDYINGSTLKNSAGQKTPLLVSPGNHDISNAIGYYKPMVPATDAGSMAGIYNTMFNPAVPKTALSYNYSTDKIHYSIDIQGIHLIVVNFWPDSAERVWMESDLQKVSSTTPVILFAHAPPDCESRLFTNPNGLHNVNAKDQFENECSEIFKDGTTISAPCTIEQRGLSTFLKSHPNITAYFHGHTNYNEYYTWKGPDNDVALNTFRVDSPMKGSTSASDETKLSFQLVTIDAQSKTMTVRECLWNAAPSNPTGPIVWGQDTTVSLLPKAPVQNIAQFVFTSDAHYGLTKTTFQGASNVDAKAVNAALVAKMNTLSSQSFPSGAGVQAGKQIGAFDFIVEGGDVANREETGIQSDSASWAQFVVNYVNGITLKNNAGQNSPLYIIPGNHDVTNAIGYYKAMFPLQDPSSMAGIYNMMLNPATPKTTSSYNYATDKIHYSKDYCGVHFMFINMWPDSSERVWMANDLKSVSSTTPVVIFSHDEPPCESKHFINPNGSHNINSTDKFENVVTEMFKDGNSVSVPAVIEQRNLAAFIKSYPNIVAYFHGNDHIEQFGSWQGPDNNISLSVFGVDSPMKGTVSSTDETKLCFQVVTLDAQAQKMTIRECFWNPVPSNPSAPVSWGKDTTISLKNRIDPKSQSSIRMNEIFSAGTTTFPDFIELYNTSASPVDISNYKIYDNGGQSGSKPKKTFPAGTVMPGYGFYVVVTDGTGTTDFGLSKSGEEVWLEDETGSIVEDIVFPALGDSQSYGRIPDGTGNWQILNTITKGTSNNVVVPVELTSFTAQQTSGKVKLTWSTATETNNKGYEIEKADRNNSFVKIGFVEGSGNSSVSKTYTFDDPEQLSGAVFYRLKQIDYSGAYTYSNSVEVNNIKPTTFSVEQNFPNPFNPSTVIKYQIPSASKVTLKVFDALGKEVTTLVNGYKEAGMYQAVFDATRYASGIYIYRLQAGSFIDSKKMIFTK